MALTTEQIDAEAFARWGEMKGAPLAMCRGFARAIEAEIRKQDEALIRQLVAALSLPCDRWNGTQSRIVREAISAGRAWLEDTP